MASGSFCCFCILCFGAPAGELSACRLTNLGKSTITVGASSSGLTKYPTIGSLFPFIWILCLIVSPV